MLFVSGFPPALRRLVVASLESPWIPKRFHKFFKGPKEGYSRNQSEQAMKTAASGILRRGDGWQSFQESVDVRGT